MTLGTPPPTSHQPIQLSGLEPRILFSATPIDPAMMPGGDESAMVAEVEVADSADSTSSHAAIDDLAEQTAVEVIFIDSAVPDIEQLLDDLSNSGRDAEVFVLDADRDGIDQITEVLDSRSGVESVHIVSHAEGGAVKLGNLWLGESNLSGYAGQFASWQGALSSDADILFYGCDLARSSSGKALVDSISALTGADVAASDDDTGHQRYAADWDLEYATGAIESEVAFTSDLQASWDGKLATITVTTFDDVISAVDGETSLREAVNQANISGDTIDLTVIGAGTFWLDNHGAGDDANVSGDLDITGTVTIIGIDAASTIIDGDGMDRVFHVTSGNLTMSDLTVQGGSISDKGGGIFVDGGSSQLTLDRVTIQNNMSTDGAGIFNDGAIFLTDVTIADNGNLATTDEGGGIHNKNDATLNRVTLSGNEANDGGGIHNDNGADSLSLTNVTVSGNTAGRFGGGLNSQNSADILNSTFTQNHAQNGGGINQSGGTLSIANTIVAANTGSSNHNDVKGTFSSLGYNLIEDVGSSGASFGAFDLVGAAAGLDPLADNGGFTQTHALQSGSLAINAGTDIGAPATDQRGETRNGPVDIGALELQIGYQDALWLSTSGDVSTSGVTGLDAWSAGEVITFGDPNLALGSGTSNGTAASLFSLDGFVVDSDANVDALHYVSTNIQLGSGDFQLFVGDVLFSTNNDEQIIAGGLNIAKTDVILFRPDEIGDYSSGTFSILLDNLGDGGFNQLQSFTLVEQTTNFGDMTLQAGEFLFAHTIFFGANDVYRYQVSTVGEGSTTGSKTKILEGNDLGLNVSSSWLNGMELIERETVIGGTTLYEGALLLQSTGSHSTVGDTVTISTTDKDIFVLDVTKTIPVSADSEANAMMLLRGSDINLDSSEERIGAIALGSEYTLPNDAPTADAGGPYVINEGDSLVLDGSGSSDSDGTVTQYLWDLDNDGAFGDETTATPIVDWATLSGTWGIDDGDVGGADYTIGLRVIDDKGLASDTQVTVTVHDVAPELFTSGNASTDSGDTYTLNLSATDYGDDGITGWIINWGDGNTSNVGAVSSADHVYDGGVGLTYNIMVSAINDDGTFHQSQSFVTSSAANPNDAVYRIQATTGEYLVATGSVFGGSQIQDPGGTVIGPDGNLYVGSFGSNKIEKFDPTDGSHLGTFVDDADLNQVAGLAFGPDGNLYVASHGSNEIHRYDGTTGARIDAAGTPFIDGLSGPIGLVFHTDGFLYVSNYNSGVIQRFDASTGVVDPGGDFVGAGTLNGPEFMVFGPGGYLYVASYDDDSIYRFDTDGSNVDGAGAYISGGGLDGPIGMTFGPDGLLYVGSENSDTVRRYDVSGGAPVLVDDYVSDGAISDNRVLVFQPAHQVEITQSASPPTVTSGGTLFYTEGDGQVMLDSGITVSDPDGTLDQATITIASNHTSTEDVLVFSDQNGISGVFSAATGTLTLSGTASVADYQTALRSITYENTSVNPNANTRLVSIQVDDGDQHRQALPG